MRHNQNGRRFRPRTNGGGQSHHHTSHNNSQRRINPRVHTFDSNGPDVRIRGNAYQITEKYQTLAKDAASAGDRVLAESYLQHAEHYQRMLNELGDDYSRNQPQGNAGGQSHQAHSQQQNGHQSHQAGDEQQQQGVDPDGEQPVIDASLPDLDQGFLVGPRRRGGATPPPSTGEEQPAVTVETRASRAAPKTSE